MDFILVSILERWQDDKILYLYSHISLIFYLTKTHIKNNENKDSNI